MEGVDGGPEDLAFFASLGGCARRGRGADLALEEGALPPLVDADQPPEVLEELQELRALVAQGDYQPGRTRREQGYYASRRAADAKARAASTRDVDRQQKCRELLANIVVDHPGRARQWGLDCRRLGVVALDSLRRATLRMALACAPKPHSTVDPQKAQVRAVCLLASAGERVQKRRAQSLLGCSRRAPREDDVGAASFSDPEEAAAMPPRPPNAREHAASAAASSCGAGARQPTDFSTPKVLACVQGAMWF